MAFDLSKVDIGRIKGGINRQKQIQNKKAFYEKLRMIKDNLRMQKSILFKSSLIKNDYVEDLIKKKIDLKYILATYILTDGSLINNNGNYRICFYAKDEVLKDLIYQILLKESKFIPGIYKEKKGIYQIRVSDNYLANELFKLNYSYKKIPSKNQKAEDFLKEKQPSLDFIKQANEEIREMCIRVALTTDGCISLPKSNKPTLSLACSNPSVCKQWMQIFSMCKIKSYLILKKDSWSGFGGIRISNNSLNRFYKMGGFIDGVKISKKSKIYIGWEKNKLLAKALNGPDEI